MAYALLHPLGTIELISGQFVVMFIWVVVIELVNTIQGMLTTPVVVAGSVKLWLKFLTTKIPLDPLPNFATNPSSTSL